MYYIAKSTNQKMSVLLIIIVKYKAKYLDLHSKKTCLKGPRQGLISMRFYRTELIQKCFIS